MTEPAAPPRRAFAWIWRWTETVGARMALGVGLGLTAALLAVLHALAPGARAAPPELAWFGAPAAAGLGVLAGAALTALLLAGLARIAGARRGGGDDPGDHA